MKRHWTALLAIVASAIIYSLLLKFIPGTFTWFLTFIWMVMLLVIGHFMSPHSKANNRWLGKVIIAIIVVFIFGFQLNILQVPEFRQLLGTLGITGGFLDLLLLYCGWAFFQV
ncbi:hypothetical protein [Erysipelothrix aquatica]|uniref:hypothetical protein n=1 Tax=Erysipelothrix aquatica TaxID=2683714 RepID=UPI00135CAE90|nr:hypothetical protein [Erysipelothrix aquatica]